jgi:hypothetical protein
MNFETQIQNHTRWILRLRNAIQANTPLNPLEVSQDNLCELGKWLHGEGKSQHKFSRKLPECVALHAAFHMAAGKAATALRSGRKDEAERLLAADAELSAISRKLAVALLELKNEVAPYQAKPSLAGASR